MLIQFIQNAGFREGEGAVWQMVVQEAYDIGIEPAEFTHSLDVIIVHRNEGI